MKKENEVKVKKEKIKKDRGTNKTVLSSIIALFVGALCMYLLVYFVLPLDTTIINKSEKEVTVTDEGIADAVEKLYDAVVVVQVYVSGTLYSSGTGFVYKTVDDTAYILTNNHVVSASGDVSVEVMFTNGNVEEVEVLGADEYSDIAVLSLDADKIISVAEIGSSEDMRVGDTVFTIGSPVSTEYYWSVTRGCLSGKDRMVEVSLSSSTSTDYVLKVLQTDASINSGNSGGPLANSNGEVIGITNMKLVSSSIEGIGFAIPIEDAVEFADAIINGESIERPLLGVSMLNLSQTYYLYMQGISLNTELTSGVVIVEVQEDSPADKGGLQKGDIITSLDGEEVTNVATLRYYLYKHSVGDKVEVTYERDGKTYTTTITLSVASE